MEIIEKFTLNLTGASRNIKRVFDILKTKQSQYVEVVNFIMEKGKNIGDGSDDESFLYSYYLTKDNFPDELEDMDFLDELMKQLHAVSRGFNIKIEVSAVHWYKSYGGGKKPELLEAGYILCSENDEWISLRNSVDTYNEDDIDIEW